MEEFLTTQQNQHLGSLSSHWWATSGWLRIYLMRLDGGVATMINIEKHVVNLVVVAGEVAGHLGLLTQQMGLGAAEANGAVGQLDTIFRLEPVKASFTRTAGPVRQQMSGR